MKATAIPARSLPGLSRQFWVVAHRWAGLTMALFLIVAGATGAILPFQDTLTWASRPSLSAVTPPAPGAAPFRGGVLAERIERQTGARVTYAPLHMPPDHVVRVGVAARAGQPPLPYDTVWADPYTGRVRLAFRYGVLADGAQNIVPFLYLVHYSFAAGAWGIWAFGVAALVWTIDCFIGFYLTLPMRRRGVAALMPSSQSWWARWKPAWLVRRGARGHKLNFDLHRASGLWLWPLLFVFAWSSVGFCLPSVHRPVMAALGAEEDAAFPPLAAPLDQPPLGFARAEAVGQALMAREGAARGFSVAEGGYLIYQPPTGLYRYSARTSLDQSHEDASTSLWFDARTGRTVRFDPPLGKTAADATMRWFYMLHMARVFGLPYRIFVSLLGLAVVALSVTGVLIWTKKRSARLLGRRRAADRALPALVPAE